MNDKPLEFDIQAVPADLGGVWSNFAAVAHSEYEFSIDFIRLDHSGLSPEGKKRGVLVSRVNLSPLMVSQLMEALSTNWDSYAEKALPKEARSQGDDAT